MNADYNSTAKALALPVSPKASSPERQAMRSLRPRPASISLRRIQSDPTLYSSRQTRGYKAKFLKFVRLTMKKFVGLPVYQRVIVLLTIIISNILMILFFLYNERIFSFLTPYAVKWRNIPAGYMILFALTFITAFPPIFGYSTCLTIAGFVYGFPNGWYIAATGTVFGSLAAFVASRTIFASYVHRLVGEDKRFKALALTLKHDGLKILIMIRLCPLPYSISNVAISTFPTVHPFSFALATAIATPKLLIHIFIGSRIAAIAGMRQDHHLDAKTKAINYASIALGIIIGATVGWIIYRRTMARARELEVTELESQALESQQISFSATETTYRDREFSVASADSPSGFGSWETRAQLREEDVGYRDYDPSDRNLDLYRQQATTEVNNPIITKF
ncbi:Golgi apparatus membrane protein [Podosphaera aphanis]|nr:Golgi apparatus membrane protein [Podosphaera aphanis]